MIKRRCSQSGFTPSPKGAQWFSQHSETVRFKEINKYLSLKQGLSGKTSRRCGAPLVRGFTILEMLVIVSVMALLSAMLLVYNRSGEKQISLFKEQAKVISVILRSKALAIQTFQQATPGCGYGTHFEAGKYLIFRDLPDPTTGCGGSDRKYSGAQENFEVIELDPDLYFSELTLDDVLFVPPDPRVFLNPDQAEASIIISTLDNASEVGIKINDAGQVTTD